VNFGYSLFSRPVEVEILYLYLRVGVSVDGFVDDCQPHAGSCEFWSKENQARECDDEENDKEEACAEESCEGASFFLIFVIPGHFSAFRDGCAFLAV